MAAVGASEAEVEAEGVEEEVAAAVEVVEVVEDRAEARVVEVDVGNAWPSTMMIMKEVYDTRSSNHVNL